MSGYIISEDDHAMLEHTKAMAGLIATGMAHTARSAEVIYPAQVESLAHCMSALLGQVLTSARMDLEADA